MNIGDKVVCVKTEFTKEEWQNQKGDAVATFKVGDVLKIDTIDWLYKFLISFEGHDYLFPECGFELYTEQNIKSIKDLEELVKRLKELDIK